MKKIIVQATGFGTGAGKSFLVALLGRIFREKGEKVAPFKALNLTGVTFSKDGKEFGYSQLLQAVAAKIEPDFRMNPFCIKPIGNGFFDLFLEGERIEKNYNPKREFIKEILKGIVGLKQGNQKIREAILRCFESLSKEFGFIIIEGSGPTKIFGFGPFSSWLEMANMEMAKIVKSPVILLTENVDSVPQTLSYLEAEERKLVKGAIINKCPINDFSKVGVKERWINLGLKRLRAIYSQKIGLEILGILPHFDEMAPLPDLDPIPPSEKVPLEKWEKTIETLAKKAKNYLELDEIYKIAS